MSKVLDDGVKEYFNAKEGRCCFSKEVYNFHDEINGEEKKFSKSHLKGGM